MWWWWWIMLSFCLLRALVLRYQLSFPTFLFGGCWHWVLSLQLFSRSYHGITTFRSYHGITYYLRLRALTFHWLINELVSHLHENYGQTHDFSDEDEHKVTDSGTTGVAYTSPTLLLVFRQSGGLSSFLIVSWFSLLVMKFWHGFTKNLANELLASFWQRSILKSQQLFQERQTSNMFFVETAWCVFNMKQVASVHILFYSVPIQCIGLNLQI